MSIRRRETNAGVRYDVQWRLPDRSKRKKTFNSERTAKQFEVKLVTNSAYGRSLDPRGARTELETVYRSWIASRPDLSAKVRRGYVDNWRLSTPRVGYALMRRILGLFAPTFARTRSKLNRFEVVHRLANR